MIKPHWTLVVGDTFIDSEGRAWELRPDDQLHRLPDPPPPDPPVPEQGPGTEGTT